MEIRDDEHRYQPTWGRNVQKRAWDSYWFLIDTYTKMRYDIKNWNFVFDW